MNEQDELDEILGALANWGQTFCDCDKEVEVPITQYSTLPLTKAKQAIESHISKNYIAKTETERWILEGRCSTIEHLAPYIDPKFKEHFELYTTSLNDQLDKLTGESNG